MRHALITAGTKGIGRRVTECLLTNGYRVTINYFSDEQAVKDITDQWHHMKDRFQFVKGDVTKLPDVLRMVQTATAGFGPVDTLINNAGPFIFERKKLTDYSEAEWFKILNGNLTAVFRLVKNVLPMMRERQFGRIITYGFQNADDAPGWIDRGPFAAAKVGLASLTRTIALEEAAHGITANMVCPGIIRPDMKEATIQAAKASTSDRTPHGRSVTGEDIARAILFLCQEDSEMISGSIIDLTGGVDVIHRYLPQFDSGH
ncbi:SDR family oxidoreductase [Camelliibacillus cellulosilyticus]|uniref:SDR family oxidoreductase n=1 Tax=Camelliibacillus cellulosilyticus TaxID=2174486 RepID=A0ABV9GJW0_9BACL